MELRAFCEDDEEELDEESKKELESSRQENEVTMCVAVDGRTDIRERELTFFSAGCSATQRERLEMLRLALQSQLGVDAANSHYTLAGSALPAGPTTTNASDGAGVGAGGQASVVVNGGAGPEASGVADGTGDDVHEGMYL